MGDENMAMVFAFPDGSASFVNGFEAGAIWAHLDSGATEPLDCGFVTGFPIHTDNLEVIRRMAHARGFRVETKLEPVKGWTPVLLTYVGEGRAKPALSLVSA